MHLTDFEQAETKYNVIYADPPWQFETYSEKGKDRSPENHYECMTLEEIENLPIAKLAAEDCILFMWMTAPLLDRQLDVIYNWGFTYKTVGFVWVKQNKLNDNPFFGLGYYTRANAEYVAIATRGKPGRPKVMNISQVVMSPIREHSRKPDEVRRNIETMYDGNRIELFARTSAPGWDTFGDEPDRF
jgi:N6-adenosine-specific RNA methylase IME4